MLEMLQVSVRDSRTENSKSECVPSKCFQVKEHVWSVWSLRHIDSWMHNASFCLPLNLSSLGTSCVTSLLIEFGHCWR